ncbi:DUF7715 family protein [Haloechinothrix halophila]|uniref:DUF7715 family protein n=1 Tax=Haloechinothrix halophila TaxID=1069073 RepID=UPI00040FEBE2|nr:hypothetical protein [Haloechinothrix halophila]
MLTIKVFVATDCTQGRRDNDFHYTDGTELVDLARSCDTDRGDPDGRCGCCRAFTGLASRKATTTAEVAYRQLTPEQYRDAFHTSYVDAGFPDTSETRQDAVDAADELRRIASSWSVGTVIERRGDTLGVRAWGDLTTRED